MNKDIRYNGYTAVPSDYDSQDGDLAVSVNLIQEDGAIHPIFPAKVMTTLPTQCKVVCVHDTAQYKHYIIVSKHIEETEPSNIYHTDLYWIDGEDLLSRYDYVDTYPPEHPEEGVGYFNKFSEYFIYGFESTEGYIDIKSVEPIGNTLVVVTDEGMHYALWKGETTTYTYLGEHIPECGLSFGLRQQLITSSKTTDISMSSTSDTLDGEMKTTFNNVLLGEVNKFIAEHTSSGVGGRFTFPFLIRYAYRLYDGTLTMHSAPVLMITSTKNNIVAPIYRDYTSGNRHIEFFLIGSFFDLDYAALLQSELTALESWSDIVKSVDIFITAPLYNYKQSGSIDSVAAVYPRDIYSAAQKIRLLSQRKYEYFDVLEEYYSWDYSHIESVNPELTPVTYSFTENSGCLEIPEYSEGEVIESIRSASQFYLLKSIKVADLTTTRTRIEIDKEYMKSLVNREVMTDDYDSHDRLKPHYTFAYNSRLNIANVTKSLWTGFCSGAFLTYTNGMYDQNGQEIATNATKQIGVSFYIEQDGRDIVVGQLDSSQKTTLATNTPYLYLYYPNANCYKAVVSVGTNHYEIPMQVHSMLSGAVYFDSWSNVTTATTEPSVSEDGNVVRLPNKLYTSEVNNPFHFPVLGINTVGTGEIMGISAAVKAMSQGQFGQFPLYAFTTDGVWALEVSSTGTYSAKQPATRDVCINPESITQMDSSVLFATDRGIMMIQGSDTTCITDLINDKDGYDITKLPNITTLTSSAMTAATGLTTPFRTFLQHAQMIYDYTNQRVIVYNANDDHAYVYSLKSHAWGMMESNIASGINSYPEALAMTREGTNIRPTVINLSEYSDDADYVDAVLITRPLKLDAPDIMKTVRNIIQRGYFDIHTLRGSYKPIRTILYGARELPNMSFIVGTGALYNWQVVWSSSDHYLRGFSGTPYKYYQVALICRLKKGESISGCSVMYQPKLTNQPR